MHLLWWCPMSSKALKILIALDSETYLSAMELSRITNYGIVEIGAHLRTLRRLDMVEMKPRTSRRGETIPPSYKSKLKKIN